MCVREKRGCVGERAVVARRAGRRCLALLGKHSQLSVVLVGKGLNVPCSY